MLKIISNTQKFINFCVLLNFRNKKSCSFPQLLVTSITLYFVIMKRPSVRPCEVVILTKYTPGR